jgi:malonyl-CoA decarboxylase
VDPVARFHLANGARLERLNWMGDPSKMGLRRSLGLMVNYVYRPSDVERNHEAYAKRGKVVAAPRFGQVARSPAAVQHEREPAGPRRRARAS